MHDLAQRNPAATAALITARAEAALATGYAFQERRRSVREPCFAVATLVLDDAGELTLQVSVVNVSQHGVGLRCPCALSVGRTCQVRMGTGSLLPGSRIEIVASRRREDGTYDVGAKFV